MNERKKKLLAAAVAGILTVTGGSAGYAMGSKPDKPAEAADGGSDKHGCGGKSGCGGANGCGAGKSCGSKTE